MSLRERVRVVVDAPVFQRVVIAVILLNAVTLGCETVPGLAGDYGWLLHVLDRAALAVFTVELVARLYAYGLRYFRDPWNCFDFIVVGIALVPATGAFSVLRALRVLRVLRLISAVPSMRRVVSALLTALPSITSIAALLALILYVGAVMATKLFSDVAPEYFGSLPSALFTLFQVMTGEAWSEVARTVMEQEPFSWIFFIAYITVTTFTVLNFFIAAAVSAMESQVGKEDNEEPEPADLSRELLAEIRELRAEVQALRTPAGGAD